MLFTLLIGLVTTGYFFLRKVIIKLRFMLSGGSGKSADQDKLPYVIFSDHKRYWNVFKPICDEFERRGVDLHYWTASPDDPALEAPYEHVTCEFIGEGNKAFARLNMMTADIVLSTTPGLDVLQWKRSKDASWYVHTLHAVGSAAGYRMFGLDYYDAVLLSGQFQVDEVRELERLRDLPPKEIEIVGLELTPFSATWKVSYEGAASFHTPEADWTAYEPWSMLEDKVCMEAKLVFSDGSTFSTGGALTTPYENDVVNLFCGWGGAINIDDVQRIVLGDVILWEA